MPKLKPYTAQELGLDDPLFAAMMRAAEKNNARRDQEAWQLIARQYELGNYCPHCGGLYTAHPNGFDACPDRKTTTSEALKQTLRRLLPTCPNSRARPS